MRHLKPFSIALLTAPAALGCLLLIDGPTTPQMEPTTSYIVQGDSTGTVAKLVAGFGGTVTHELEIIDAVGASLTDEQIRLLRGLPQLRVHPNWQAEVAKKGGKKGGGNNTLTDPDSVYPTMVGADLLHAQGTTGTGVTLAVIDSGMSNHAWVTHSDSMQWRLLARYNAIADRMDRLGDEDPVIYGVYSGNDSNGHGTHVSSIAFSTNTTEFDPNTGEYSGLYHGIAPGSEVVSVKAFDRDGLGTYADVIRGLEWVVTNRDFYGIRVLNLSFSADPRSYYWDDPLNQAVMAAWQAGIVVVASAGNNGPDPMTIGVPGNVPYIITVGAMTDHYTHPNENHSDDQLASFSSAGPTHEGFVKPEIVAPGGHMLGMVPYSAKLAGRLS